jgi:hypothetical protein
MRTLVYPIVLALLFAVRLVAAQTPQDSGFTYQGELFQNNEPVTASVDMVLTLYDAATVGNVIGTPVTMSASGGNPVSVVDGLFTVTLDFGASSFITAANDARWLAVSVAGNALSPRTKIESAPYALIAQMAYGVPAGSIGTTQINAVQIQRRVSGSCASGSSISVINQDGTVSCQSVGSGTITGVTPAGGSGITGGGTSGNVSLGTDLTVLQSRVTGTCPSGSAISVVARDGTVTCQSAGITLPYAATQTNAGPLINITNTDASSASTALQGTSNSTAANVSAVEGVISSTTPGNFSAGVLGINNSTTSNGIGVYGKTLGSGPGVNGTSASGPGVYGTSTSSYSGYFASASSNNLADTLHVDTANPNARGIYSIAGLVAVAGEATSGSGIGMEGQGYEGVAGQSFNTRGFGVVGYSNETTTADPLAYPFPAMGPVGVYGQAAAPSGVGVFGHATDTTGSNNVVNVGVYGQADGPNGIGLLGFAGGLFGTAVAAIAEGSNTALTASTGADGIAIFAEGGEAALLVGNVQISEGGLGINTLPPTTDIELAISSQNPANPSADILLQPYLSNFGFDISVGGSSASNMTFGIYQTPDGLSYNQSLGLDAAGDLAISGGTATKPGGGAWSAPSDARLKRDIQPLDHVLDKLLQLRGVTFEYANPDGYLHPAGRHTGFIAQQVQEVFPDWIGQTPDGYLTVGAKGFEAMAVEALRELRAEKDAEIDGLQGQLDDLSARLDRLENAREAQQ